MSKIVTTVTLNALPQVTEFLTWPCDFELRTPPSSDEWFTIEPGIPYQLIAGDGSGGLFGLTRDTSPDTAPLFHVSSEGQAGFIAWTLTEGIQLMVAHPNWRDLLKFSGGGKLSEMRRAVPYLETELKEDEPNIDSDRANIFRLLDLKRPEEPVSKLHAVVTETSKRYTFVSKEGWDLESLFNSLRVDDNPMWRNRHDT